MQVKLMYSNYLDVLTHNRVNREFLDAFKALFDVLVDFTRVF